MDAEGGAPAFALRVRPPMDVFARLEREIGALDEGGRDLVRNALAIARIAHAGQTRDEGSDYIEHPVRVALILLDECGVRDPAEIATALCHDVLEDSQIAAGELAKRTSPEVASQVSALTKDPIATALAGDARTAAKTARDNRYYALIAEAPLAVRRVKCADRLDNLRSVGKSPEKGKASRYAAETRIHVLPIARATEEHLAKELDALCDELAGR